MSATEERVPDVVDRITVAPPVVRLFPLASFTWIVMVLVLEPLATIVLEDAVIVDVAVLGEPGIKFTISLSVIDGPFNVPVIDATPTVVDDVSVAVYVPLPLSVTEERLPKVVERVTAAPPAVRLFPLASFN